MSTNTPLAIEKNISDVVLGRINQLEAAKALYLPKDYVPENALKSAWLIIKDLTVKEKDKDGKEKSVFVTEYCSKDSITNALFDMVVQGLNPLKKQCYFIPYAKSLTMMRSYMGTVAVAKRFGGLTKIKAQVVYEGDDFVYEINTDTGCKKIVKHGQKIENINISKIKGAYAVYQTEDGTIDVEIMTKAQIEASWKMGVNKGESRAHSGFTDQMALKTVTSRACKLLINTSSDLALLGEQDENDNREIIEEARNTTDIGFEEVSTTTTSEGQSAQAPAIVNDQQPTAKVKRPETEAAPQANDIPNNGPGNAPGF